MTPKEKAEQLYNKCNPHCLTKNFYGDNIEVQSTKKCALIAVEEILSYITITTNQSGLIRDFQKQYWHEVRTEIENL
jgi:hypothetical protein